MSSAIFGARRRWHSFSRQGVLAALAVTLIAPATSFAQSPSTLYTWATPASTQNWNYFFGGTGASATATNNIAGELTVQETSAAAGASIAFADGGNRVRESSVSANGGTDLTGLDWLEYEIGHNGTGPINVQFYTQAAAGTGPSPGYAFTGLGPDVAIAPGVATYRVPLTGLPPDQIVYIRQMGVQVREHAAQGNVTWTVREVRAGGTPLKIRNLITHNDTAVEGGLQGAIGNFDLAAIQGNNGGQNQSGLTHSLDGGGSLQWIDLGGSNGAAITWGNGTPWATNGFNQRTADLSGYTEMVVRMRATDPLDGGGTLGVQGFFQNDGFQFRAANGSAPQLPIDGQFHDLKYDISGLAGMNVVEHTGINLGSHPQNLTINVDNIRFRKVAFQEHRLFSWENSLEGWTTGPEPGHTHTIVSTGATHGATALEIDRRGSTPVFIPGSQFDTTSPAVIADLVPRINDAAVVAFDVTFQSYVSQGISPTFTNFYVAFDDHNGGIYQASTSGININAANPAQTVTMRIPVESFTDPTEGSTKTLVNDGLLASTNRFTIHLITNTDDGAVYQIDNFRLLTEVTEDTADFNSDTLVNGLDYNEWTGAFGANSVADADGDGDSDGYDFLAWQRNFGKTGAAEAAGAGVPEPASWLLAAGLAVAAAVRRPRV